MRNFIKLVAVLAAFLTAPLALDAKPLGKILADSGLSPKDFELLSATEEKLYIPTVKKAGSQLTWSNPDTGAHGSVRLVEVRGKCIYIQHFVFPKDEKTPIEIRPQLCKAADGRWLLAP